MASIPVILLLIATIATVNAVIDTSRYESYYKERPRATYSDIVKAMFLVNFNLSKEELDTFKTSPWPDVRPSTHNMSKVANEFIKYWTACDGYNQGVFQMDLFLKTFSDVKSNDDIYNPRYSKYYNALYMAMNYDYMAQILDPNYKTNFFNIIPVGRRWSLLAMNSRLSTFKRWGVDLTGIGTRHIDDIIRGNFALLSDDQKEDVRRQVYRLYVSLDDYILEKLNQTSSGYSDIHDQKCSLEQTEDTYKDIIKAADLIDFNLSEKERNWIEEFAWPTGQRTTNPELADDWEKELSQIESRLPDQNTSVDPKPRNKRVVNALYLIINYDAMGQILDSNYEPRMFNFTRATQQGTKDSLNNTLAMQLLHNRWKPNLLGIGFQPSDLEYLSYQYFDKANENRMEEIRREVCRMRLRLDKLVLDALKDQLSSK